MAPTKDAHHDDYYSHVSKSSNADDSIKKPIKLKLKVVAKKPLEEETLQPKEPTSHTEIAPPPEEVVVAKPKARLVEREHASEGLLRSVMHRNVDTGTHDAKDERKKPAISFGKVESKFKPLENRPVMQLPPEERRTSRPPRRDGTSSSNSATAPTHTGTQRLRDDAKPMFQRQI